MAEPIGLAIAEAIEAIAFSGEMVFTATQATMIGSAAIAASAMAVGGYQRRRMAAKARAAYLASLKDREVMIRSAVAPRRIIYGRDKVSGPIVYAESTGDKGQYLHLVIALAAHECDAIEEVWFNDTKLPTPNAGGYITSGDFARTNTITPVGHTVLVPAGGSVTLPQVADVVTVVTSMGTGSGESSSPSEPITGWAHTAGTAVVTGLPVGEWVVINYETTESIQPVRIKAHLGGTGQVADADLVAESDGKWTSAHVGAGICYLYVRLEYDQEIFAQVGVPNISAVVRGKRVRDPRTGLTAWSDNAALCVADWLRDSRYGLGASADEVPDAEVIAAANICDETIDLAAGGTTTQARYNYAGSFTTDQSPRDVLSDLLSGMAGTCVWTQGRWLVRPGAYRAPALTITADHLAGRGVSIQPKASRSELFNAVRATYRDPTQGWAEVQAPLVTNALYEAQDGGRRLVRSIQLPGAMDHWRAQRLAKIELERARQSVTVQLVGNTRTYDLAPTDTTALTLDRYGFAAKVFEVLERTWSVDGTLAYTMRETAAGVWAWNYGEATTVDLAPDTALPSPFTPPPALAGLTIASGTAHLQRLSDGTVVARAFVQWTACADVFVLQGGRIEVQWKRDDDAEWQSTPSLPGDATSTYLSPMPDQRAVLIRVRAVNAAGRSGPWATAGAVIVGKTEPPADVTGLAAAVVQGGVAIQWDACLEPDYAETELRLGASWAAGVVIFAGKTNVHAFLDVPDGTYTVWAKHRDSSGNESATAAPIEFTFTASGGISTSLRLSCSAEVIAVDEAGGFTPSTVTFTAFSAFSGSPVFTITGGTLTGTGATRTMAVSSMGGDSAEVQVAWGGQTDTRTVVKVYDGVSVDVEYSVNGTTGWHSTYTAGDIYARYKRGAGAWSAAVKIVGEDGSAGDYTDFIFIRSSTQPATPTGASPAGWSDAPPAANGQPLWASTASKTAAGALIGVWSTPVRISGDDSRSIAVHSNGGHAFVAASQGTTYSPSSIILSRELLNGLAGGGTTTWSIVNGTFTGSLTVLNPTTGAFPGFGPSAMGTDAVAFRCTYVEGAYTYTDDITIFKSRDGMSAYLTNEVHGLPTSVSGVVESYSGASGTFKVTNGAGDVAGGLAFTIVGYSGFGTSYSTPGSSQDGGNITINPSTGFYQVIGGVTTAAALATVTLRATYTNPLGGTQTFDRVFTLNKVRKGDTGAQGPTGPQGPTGGTGASGTSARRAYALYSGNPTVTGSAVVKSGSTLPSTSDFFPTAATAFSTSVQNPGAGQAMFQSDGLYDPVTNQTTWGTPYLSNLKVGNLSAISADLGTITAGTITGALIRTASSGARIELDYASNTLTGYNASGVSKFSVNMNTGFFAMNGNATVLNLVQMINDSPGGNSNALYLSNNNQGATLRAQNSSTGAAIWGENTGSGPGGRFSSLRLDQTPTTGAAAANNSAGGAALVNKPGAASNNSWLSVNLSGTTYYIPVWT